MNKVLLFCLLTIVSSVAVAQGTYYWVGGAPTTPQAINVLTNWNTLLDGSGSPRTSNTAADVLIFDGTNYGGATPTTGTDSVNNAAGITCAQLKFVNGAKIVFIRATSGTSTMTISGDGTPGTEDFLIESGCSLSLSNGPGSQVINVGGTNNSGRVSGDFRMVTGLQARIANGTATGTTLVFTLGSTFTTNITSASAAYPFGNASQSTEKWVTFQSGATLFYDGGFSAMGSSAAFQPVNFLPGSRFVMRASNPVGSGGTFFNRKAFANVTVQNGATLTADGTINAVDTLNVTPGSTFTAHSSGQTVVLGDVIANGTIGASATSTNEFLLAGRTTQTLSGSGTVAVASLVVADSANVVLGANISVARSATVFGKIDFGTAQLTGAGNFLAQGTTLTRYGAGNTVAGAYLLTGVSGGTPVRGMTVNGAGIQPGTRITGVTSALDSIYISRPALATASGVSLVLNVNPATLATSNSSGFNSTSGSVALTDNKIYDAGINYIINAATASPFGISAGATSAVSINNLQLNAAVTTNATAYISGTLQSSGKTTIRPLDTLWLQSTATLAGTYNSSNYFVTGEDAGGDVGVFQRDGINGATLLPIGTPANYLPVTVTPTTASDFAVNVFEGITTNADPAGQPFTTQQKQTVVDAVWNVNRVAGSGEAALKLQWTSALEGTTLATFANSEIGIIRNTGTAWSLPFGTGDNATNTADTTFSTFGNFSVGARPPANPFVFNPLPPKTYGDADFSPGVISSNITSPVNYTSSNTAVATIVNGLIRITGTGTTTITAQQASDGFYPAANVSQTLTVSKASLTIKADRKTKPQGDPNPPLTATYTGFVSGETTTVLQTQAVLTTTATLNSLPGSYPITVSGATAANYNISFVNDSLLVRPRTAQTITFNAVTARTYGAADFAIGATSSNGSIPVTYTSSNPAVAIIVGNNIRIVGAGTTTITASQAGSDLFFPAVSVSQTLVVNPAPLTIRVTDTTKAYGQPNPTFRIVYSGFVLGQNSSVFATQPTISTTAAIASAPGYYLLDPTGVVAPNYAITYVSGRLTVFPATGTAQAALQAFLSNSSTLTVRIYSPEPDLGDVWLFDMSGRPVAVRNVFLAPGFVTVTMPVGNAANGIYVVKVTAKNTALKLTVPIVR